MKFDYVVGNPPYEDIQGGANKKLWKDITRNVQGLATRQIIFVTPMAQLQYLLYKHTFYIDYLADDYFDVGTRIIAWGMSAKPASGRKVYSTDGTIDDKWYNNPERHLVKEFKDLKSQKNKLFKRQDCGKGDLVCIKNASKDTQDTCLEYVIPDGHKILAISTSKSLKRENILIGYEHYGSLYAQIDINDWSEDKLLHFIDNLLAPGFVRYCDTFRKYFNTGFNNVLLYTDSLHRRI